MSFPHQRLALARAARFPNARQAALALGIAYATYLQYETGERGFSRHAERFAQFFRVDLTWLISGKGDMRGKSSVSIPVTGIVTAGGETVTIEDDDATPDQITLPEFEFIAALQVRGNSQFPRFQNGEWVLYDKRPTKIAETFNKFAVVALLDGRRMLKILREGRSPHVHTLESLNAPPILNVELLGVYRYVGVLAEL